VLYLFLVSLKQDVEFGRKTVIDSLTAIKRIIVSYQIQHQLLMKHILNGQIHLVPIPNMLKVRRWPFLQKKPGIVKVLVLENNDAVLLGPEHQDCYRFEDWLKNPNGTYDRLSIPCRKCWNGADANEFELPIAQHLITLYRRAALDQDSFDRMRTSEPNSLAW